ncbi:protein tyrosine phosphatase [Rahnella sp. EDr1-12]|uniref:arsenate reductase/protein-tyrosine-phosphatase family protein n=1 Tax=unclassified Rahnella TaxID=2635087 RepID=UPI003BAACC97
MGRLSCHRILVVCVGNICRSPLGERLLRQYLPGHDIRSAGLMALSGHDIDRDAALVAARYGIDTGGHCARQLDAALCRRQDLILVMEKHHIAMLARIVPEAEGKTMLFNYWDSQQDITDPFNRSLAVHEQIAQQLITSAQGWGRALDINDK